MKSIQHAQAPNADRVTDYQRDLLDKLAAVKNSIEGYRATLDMLEIERRRIEYQLRGSGYRPPAKVNA